MFQQNLAFCSNVLWIQILCDILTIPIQIEPSTSTEKFWGEAQHGTRQEVHTARASQAEAVGYGSEMFSSREGNRITSSNPSKLYLVLPRQT